MGGLRCGTSEGGHKESPAADTPYGMASGGLQRLAKVSQGRNFFLAQMHTGQTYEKSSKNKLALGQMMLRNKISVSTLCQKR